MATYERDFKGVWIPREVWLDTRLNALDKMILTEIDSLDMSERGCFASNKHIADFCQCSESKVSKSISALIEYGYIYVKSFDGRQRELKSRLSELCIKSYAEYEKTQGSIVKNAKQNSKKCNSESEKMIDSNTYNNPDINTERRKERKKETRKSFDDLIDEYTENEELRSALRDYIQMRKAIKKPVTNRALELAFKNLDGLTRADVDKVAIVNQSIMNSWQGLFPLKNNTGGYNDGKRGSNDARNEKPLERGSGWNKVL